jgi:hypothetical protein
MGRHAPGRLRLVQTEHGVRGAAHLEGPRLLEVLALEEHLAAGQAVQE